MKNIFERRLFMTLTFGLLFIVMWFFNDNGQFLLLKLKNIGKTVKDPKIKYILLWTDPKSEPFSYFKQGKDIFYRKKCPVQSCYVSTKSVERLLKENITEFDAILFHGPELTSRNPQKYLPSQRSAKQIYIFVSMESSHNYYIMDSRYNGVFNYTWTYKIDSDIGYQYMVIKDIQGKIIGPNITVPWINIEDMLPINDEVKSKLAEKTIAAAWIVSNCKSFSKREIVAENLMKELKKYNMTVDIFGFCGNKKCPLSNNVECLQRLQKDYYFYFAFENSIGEDYVTEKVLKALQNYVVPVVYGGADYKRFMPDGIYLNVRKMSITQLAIEMVESIRDKEKYEKFFKWHNHYSYYHPEESTETDPHCSLCKFVNNVDYDNPRVIDNFYKWWNPMEVMKIVNNTSTHKHVRT